MTTARSPIQELKAQAAQIASMLKKAERGEKVAKDPAGKIAAARKTPSVKFAVFMDDKILNIEMSWAKIRDTTQAGLAEYIVDQMREARDTIH